MKNLYLIIFFHILFSCASDLDSFPSLSKEESEIKIKKTSTALNIILNKNCKYVNLYESVSTNKAKKLAFSENANVLEMLYSQSSKGYHDIIAYTCPRSLAKGLA